MNDLCAGRRQCRLSAHVGLICPENTGICEHPLDPLFFKTFSTYLSACMCCVCFFRGSFSSYTRNYSAYFQSCKRSTGLLQYLLFQPNGFILRIPPPRIALCCGINTLSFPAPAGFCFVGRPCRNRTCALLLLKQSLFLTELKVGFGYRCAAGIVQPPFERQNAIHLQYVFLRFVLTLSLRLDAALACSARTYHPLTALLSFASVLRAV